MQKKQLGNTDLFIPPIVFGGNVFGWTLNKKESFRILDKLYEMGFRTIDTADVYSRWADGNSGGESETIIGEWMQKRGNREKMTIITKVGSDMGQGGKDLSKDYILQAAEQSLERLQVEQIDLYLTHWDDPSTPVKETLEAYNQLVEAGKVRHIGASNLSADRLRASLETSDEYDLPRYEVFQPEYNLYARQEFEEGVGPICKQENLGVISYYALASGFLTGKYRDKSDLKGRARGSSVEKYLDKRGFQILDALDTIAEKHDTSLAAVSLAWLINKPVVTAPIASATEPEHLDAFRDAVDLELEPEDMEKLDRASAYKKQTV